MSKTFGSYSSWAIVFLIIFVLFVLMIPVRQETVASPNVGVY